MFVAATVLATVPTSEQTAEGSSPVSSTPSDHATEGKDESKESEGKSRMDKWNELPTAAHVGIIGGAAVVGLVSLVFIRFQPDYETKFFTPHFSFSSLSLDVVAGTANPPVSPFLPLS